MTGICAICRRFYPPFIHFVDKPKTALSRGRREVPEQQLAGAADVKPIDA